jgi:pimeloyl-ACP methyl ester carboxylesterase
MDQIQAVMQTSAFHPFRSAQAQEEYLTYYDQRAQGWPIVSETKLVKTSFGQTFVRVSGPSGESPLVLLPASVFNSLMWMPNIEALSKNYRTYAVDNIYDCGRSIYTRPLKSPEDFVKWLDELFTALEPDHSINVMGLSYGSWLAHQYALHSPQRLRKMVLLAHPTITPMNREFIFRLMLAFFSSRRFKDFVYWLFEDTVKKGETSQKLVDSIYGDMHLAGRCFKPKTVVNPTPIKDHELRELQVPTLFLVGENEKTFSPQKAVQRLNQVAPQIRTQTIPHAGHDLNFAQVDLVNEWVLEFLK